MTILSCTKLVESLSKLFPAFSNFVSSLILLSPFLITAEVSTVLLSEILSVFTNSIFTTGLIWFRIRGLRLGIRGVWLGIRGGRVELGPVQADNIKSIKNIAMMAAERLSCRSKYHYIIFSEKRHNMKNITFCLTVVPTNFYNFFYILF